jgi:hypothetical protein
MAVFQFYLKSGKHRKLGWVGDDSHVVFGNKFPGNKGSVRRCDIMMQQPVLLSSKFGGWSLRTFSCSCRKTSQQYTELLVWPTRTNSLWTIPLMSKKMMSMLDFALHLSHLFQSRWVRTFHVRLMLSSQNACLIIARVSVALFPRFVQNLMLFLCQIHH